MRAPLVTRDEASRIFALAGLVALLVFVPITRRALAPRPLAPTASCVDGAHRRADGAVACGRTGERLPARAELLLGTPLELNDAAASELELVPGVGPALARRIVEVRRADGPFDDVAALDRVPGIGPALVARIAPWVRVARSRGSPVARSAGAAARP